MEAFDPRKKKNSSGEKIKLTKLNCQKKKKNHQKKTTARPSESSHRQHANRGESKFKFKVTQVVGSV